MRGVARREKEVVERNCMILALVLALRMYSVDTVDEIPRVTIDDFTSNTSIAERPRLCLTIFCCSLSGISRPLS